MVILNKNEEAYTLKLDRFREMLGQVFSGKEIISGETISLRETITIPGPGPMIVELNNE
jgi:hypothetical protein